MLYYYYVKIIGPIVKTSRAHTYIYIVYDKQPRTHTHTHTNNFHIQGEVKTYRNDLLYTSIFLFTNHFPLQLCVRFAVPSSPPQLLFARVLYI